MAYYGATVEYALHTLLNLARVPEGTVASSRDLADFQRLPVPFMRKLLTQLEKSGVVVSTPGVRGGWRLARDPAQISLLEVADAAQPGVPLLECREIRQHCALWEEGHAPEIATRGMCEIHAALRAAELAMRRELASRTLAGIAAQVAAKTGGSEAVSGWFEGRYQQRKKQPISLEDSHD